MRKMIAAYEVLERQDLQPDERHDLDFATKARRKAFAPYSNFLVGVAIRTGDGKVYPGWNFQNVVHDDIHAEENALGRLTPKSRAAGLKRVVVVGGLADAVNEDPVAPCGICRQKLFELLRDKDMTDVIMAGTQGKVISVLLKDLLPFAFMPAELKKG